MKYLQALGTEMPALGFGTWDLTGTVCELMVTHALSVGYRHLDCAAMYGNEIHVGKGIAAARVAREELFITTKVWHTDLHRGDVVRSAEKSLRDLKLDYVDLLLIHWPDPATPLQETLDAMNELKEAGRTRQIGVANFPVKLMREAIEGCGAEIFCNQVEYHPYLPQQAVLEYATSKDVLVNAYSPLAQGKHDFSKAPALTAAAEQHGKTVPQVMLRWLMQQDSVGAIPKSSKERHCRANFEIFDFELSDQEMQAISSLAMPSGRGRVVIPADPVDWDMH